VSEFWITPPEFYKKLDGEFHFDFDPCPYPRQEGYNSLVLPWGKSNYVNPPFNKKDAPFGGPSAFVRKAIEEQQNGKTSVFVLPLPWNLGLLMAAEAEMRYGGIVRWLDGKTNRQCPRRAPQVIAILKAKSESACALINKTLPLPL
jgi:hypothetical protein